MAQAHLELRPSPVHQAAQGHQLTLHPGLDPTRELLAPGLGLPRIEEPGQGRPGERLFAQVVGEVDQGGPLLGRERRQDLAESFHSRTMDDRCPTAQDAVATVV